MLKFSRNDHCHEHLMIQSQQLLKDIDFWVNYNILQQNKIIGIGTVNKGMVLSDLNYIDFACFNVQARQCVFVSQKPFFIKFVFDRLFLFEKGFQDRHVLCLHNHIDPATVREKEFGCDSHLASNNQSSISICFWELGD